MDEILIEELPIVELPTEQIAILPDEQPNQKTSPSLLDVSNYILFLSNFQRRVSNLELIGTDNLIIYEGFSKTVTCYDYWIKDRDRIDNPVMIERNFDYVNFYSSPVAYSRLKSKVCQFIDQLSFDGYCLAGGACLWALQGQEHRNLPSDLDFFPIIGEITGHDWKEKKLLKVKEIYQQFVEDVKKIEQLINDYGVDHKLLIWESQNCTTFNFKLNAGFHHSFKLSFIHRAYETEEHVLKTFDFAPCQVLYDGKKFKCTLAAALSIIYCIIPVDISSAGVSLHCRLEKYHYNKKFSLIFPGLDKFRIRKEIPYSYDCDSVRLRINLAGGGLISIYSKFMAGCSEYYSYSATIGKCSKQEDEAIDIHTLEQNSAYGDYSEFIFSKEDRFDYYGMKSFLIRGHIYKRASSVIQYENNPEVPNIERGILKYCSFDGLRRATGEVNEVFHAIFQDKEKSKIAINYFMNKNQKEFNRLLDLRLPEVIESYDEAVKRDSEQGINWIFDKPGVKIKLAFKPLNLTAKEFYNGYYNGYTCTPNWPARAQIIMAWRRSRNNQIIENDCYFCILDKAILKKIFFYLDEFYYQEIIEQFSQLVYLK